LKMSRNDVPDVLRDPKTGKSYKKGKFLGKVSFFQIDFEVE